MNNLPLIPNYKLWGRRLGFLLFSLFLLLTPQTSHAAVGHAFAIKINRATDLNLTNPPQLDSDLSHYAVYVPYAVNTTRRNPYPSLVAKAESRPTRARTSVNTSFQTGESAKGSFMFIVSTANPNPALVTLTIDIGTVETQAGRYVPDANPERVTVTLQELLQRGGALTVQPYQAKAAADQAARRLNPNQRTADQAGKSQIGLPGASTTSNDSIRATIIKAEARAVNVNTYKLYIPYAVTGLKKLDKNLYNLYMSVSTNRSAAPDYFDLNELQGVATREIQSVQPQTPLTIRLVIQRKTSASDGPATTIADSVLSNVTLAQLVANAGSRTQDQILKDGREAAKKTGQEQTISTGPLTAHFGQIFGIRNGGEDSEKYSVFVPYAISGSDTLGETQRVKLSVSASAQGAFPLPVIPPRTSGSGSFAFEIHRPSNITREDTIFFTFSLSVVRVENKREVAQDTRVITETLSLAELRQRATTLGVDSRAKATDAAAKETQKVVNQLKSSGRKAATGSSTASTGEADSSTTGVGAGAGGTGAGGTEGPNPLAQTYTFKPTLRAILRITKADDNLNGLITWNAIPDAVKYMVQNVQTNQPAVDPNFDGSQTSVQVLNIGRGDTFRVIAYDKDDKIITEGLTSRPDVVLAPTEFGLIGNLGAYVKEIMVYAIPLSVILSVFMVIYAGILLMFFPANPDRSKEAKEIVQGALLGMIIILISRLFVDFLALPNTDIRQGSQTVWQTHFIETAYAQGKTTGQTTTRSDSSNASAGTSAESSTATGTQPDTTRQGEPFHEYRIIGTTTEGEQLRIFYTLNESYGKDGSEIYFSVSYPTANGFTEVRTPALSPSIGETTVAIPGYVANDIDIKLQAYRIAKDPGLFDYEDIKETLPKPRYPTFASLIGALVNAIIEIRAALFVFAMIVTGILFIMAQGDPEQAKKAKNNIVWILTAAVIYILAYYFIIILRSTLTDFIQGNPF